jgi:hypothetical protein
MRHGFLKLIAAGVVGLASFAANAATVQFSVTTTPTGDGSTGTWQAFLTLGNTSDTAGLAAFNIDVVGAGGVTVTGSTNAAPTNIKSFTPPSTFVSDGFNLLANNGSNGIGIQASQSVAYAGANDSAKDALVYQGVGIAAGSSTGPFGTVNWANPVLLASGTYSNSGLGGTITANIHTGGLITLLNGANGSGWTGPGNVTNVSVATPGEGVVAPVPEPTSLALLGLASAGILARRRRVA